MRKGQRQRETGKGWEDAGTETQREIMQLTEEAKTEAEGGRERERDRLCNLQRKQRRKHRDRERDYVTYRGSRGRNTERGIMPLTEEAETETQRERERICNLTTNYNRLGYPPCQQAHNVHTSAGGVEPNHQLHDKKEQNRPNTSSKLKEQPRYKNTPPPPKSPTLPTNPAPNKSYGFCGHKALCLLTYWLTP